MKRPEYSAGVTALYRKYIDLYYKEPEKEHPISKEDMEILKSLYLRTGISNGYYHRHNGKEMVTIDSPAYNGTSDKVLESVKEKYLDKELKIKSNIQCELILGEKAKLSMTASANGETFTETVWGNVVEAASKRPMDKESVLKQLSRLGNTPFEADDISVMIDDKGLESGIFVPVSELNELRRSLCEKVMEKISKASGSAEPKEFSYVPKEQDYSAYKQNDAKDTVFDISVLTKQQLDVALSKCREAAAPGRVYVDSLLFLSEGEDIGREIKKLSDSGCTTEFIVALPFVTREEAFDQTADLKEIASTYKGRGFSGALIRNLEQLGFYKENSFDGKVILDYGVYNWNAEAAKLLLECNDQNFFISEISAPLELNVHETKEFISALRKEVNIPISYEIYGRVPMMISAGCVKKTTGSCSGQLNKLHSEKLSMVDRMENVLDITTNCRNCYNVIWNAHPTALHKKLDNLLSMGMINRFRIDFTTEDAKTASLVYDAFADGDPKSAGIFDSLKFTAGHFKRGVE
jgi:putative protease